MPACFTRGLGRTGASADKGQALELRYCRPRLGVASRSRGAPARTRDHDASGALSRRRTGHAWDCVRRGATAILPMIGSGQVRALGVAEPVRAQSMPDIPTLREAGVPNFSAPSWLAPFAPRGTP